MDVNGVYIILYEGFLNEGSPKSSIWILNRCYIVNHPFSEYPLGNLHCNHESSPGIIGVSRITCTAVTWVPRHFHAHLVSTEKIPVIDLMKLSETIQPVNHHDWLVVWNIFSSPYIGNSNPNWLIFFRGLETTNQKPEMAVSRYFFLSKCCQRGTTT